MHGIQILLKSVHCQQCFVIPLTMDTYMQTHVVYPGCYLHCLHPAIL